MSGCGCEIEIKNKEQSRVLVQLLAINGVMFVAEIIAGIVGDSTALIADSLDMLADATVYAIGLYAVGRSLVAKEKAAHISGIFQVMLGLGVLFDIVRRFFVGSEPESLMMIAVGAVALIANTLCLRLIYKHRQGEVHMRASWIFSKNDVIANLGVIIGGVMVAWFASPWPDLIIGLIIAVIVISGGVRIINEANKEKKGRCAVVDQIPSSKANTNKKRSIKLLLLGIFTLISVAIGIQWSGVFQPEPIPQHLQNMGGDFTLRSADGPVALKDFRGKVVLIYFGYTNCPDACPLTMANWARALKQLTEKERSKVQGMLVSVDPERDTPETLNEYTAFFHPNIIGVTGSNEELRKIVSLYRSDFEIEQEGDSENYSVAHMSFVYVIDPQGNLRDLLAHESLPEGIVKSVRNALKVGG